MNIPLVQVGDQEFVQIFDTEIHEGQFFGIQFNYDKNPWTPPPPKAKQQQVVEVFTNE